MAAELNQLYRFDPATGKFFLDIYDGTGQITEHRELSAEEFLQGAGALYLEGAPLVEAEVGKNTVRVDPGTRITEEDFVNSALAPGLQAILQGPGDDEAKTGRLRAGISDPQIIDILRRQGLSEETVRRIWPDVDERLQNLEPADAPTPVPSNRIDNSDAQGVGPLPPAPAVAGETTPPGRGDGAAASQAEDSGGQGTSSSPEHDGKTGGDPLVLFTGQFYHQVTDLAVKGRGLHFSFTRTYLNQVFYKGPLGYNWDHSYNLWLRVERETLPDGTLQNVVYRSTGQLREDRYVQVLGTPVGGLPPLGEFADAVFRPPEGFFDRLEKSGGRFILETTTGVRFEYNEDLYVERIRDLNGNEMTFGYDPASKLLSVIRDPVGKEFFLEYDEMNRITCLRDVTGGRRICYDYGSNGDLEEVDFDLAPDLVASTDYRYSGPDLPLRLQHNLLEIIGPEGESVLENEYGAEPDTWDFNRVVWQRSADGEYRYEYGLVFETLFDPALDPLNEPRTLTRVRYPNNHLIEHWFNGQGNVVRRTEQVLGASGFGTLTAVYRYNADGKLVEETRPDGGALEYRYGREAYADLHGGRVEGGDDDARLAFGNLLRTVERPRFGFGESRRIVTEYSYHPTNRLKSQRGPFYADETLRALAGQAIGEVGYTYDARGNLTKITYPDVLGPDGQKRPPAPSEFSYDAHGGVTDVRSGTLHARYVYHPDLLRSGFPSEKVEDVGGLERRTRYAVDELGRMLQGVDHYGAVTNIEWTTFDAPRRVTLPEVAPGRPRPTVGFTYDRNRRPVRVEEVLLRYDGSPHSQLALVLTFRYDAYGRQVEYGERAANSPAARVRRTSFNSVGQPTEVSDFLGNATAFRYDERLRLSAVVSGARTPQQATRRMYYNSSGEIVRQVDERGFRTVIERDAFGRPGVIRDPDGNEMRFTYDAAGRTLRQQAFGKHPETGLRVKWAVTDFRYDAAGRCVEQVEYLFTPGAQGEEVPLRTQFFFNAVGSVEAVVDAEGGRRQYEYDGLNRLVFTRDAAGNETSFRYDDARRVLTVVSREVGTDESNKPVVQMFRRVTRFDARGLPVEQTDGLGNVVRQGFDSRGQLAYVVDANGGEQFTDYDAFGRAVSHRARLAGREVRTEFSFDANGNLTSLVSPSRGGTAWTYDGLGRVTAVERGGVRGTFEYDAAGHLVVARDGNGVTIRRDYTPAGFLRAERADLSGFVPPASEPSYTPSATPALEFFYTPLGSLARAAGGTPLLVRHDSLERVIEERVGDRAVAYRYDRLGRWTGLTFPGGRDLDFGYDLTGGLKSISQKAAGAGYPGDPAAPAARTLVSLTRVGARPLSLQFGAGHRGRLSYDSGRRVVGIDWTRDTRRTTLARERNLYGARGEWNLHQTDAAARLFGYDALVRLVRADDYAGAQPLDVARLAPPGTEAGLPTAARQAEIDALAAAFRASLGNAPAERSFLYRLDDNANRLETSYTLARGGPATTTPYNPNNLDQYESVGGTRVTYDHAGNLLDDGVNRYRYDAYNHLSEVLTPAGTLTCSRDPLSRPLLVRGPAGVEEYTFAGLRLIEWRRGGAVSGQVVPLERAHQYAHLAVGGADYAPLFNMMDTVYAWVAPDGNIVSASLYDPFGQVLQRGASWPAPFGFAGYFYDEQSRLYLLPARAYHARFGRFLQRDPNGFDDGPNLYAYARHAPGTLTDYWGFTSNDIDWGTVAWEGVKTAAVGLAIGAAAGAAVGLGVISAPVLLTIGGLALAGSAMTAFFRRSEEAFDAGKTDFTGTAALAAVTDAFGLTGLYEGATGRDVVTDRALGGEERSRRLGTGLGGVAGLATGPKSFNFGKGAGEGAIRSGLVNPYTIPSVSRPTFRNPLLSGTYVTPEGLVLQTSGAWGGLKAGASTLLRTGSGSRAYAAALENSRGNFPHILRHFLDQPGRVNRAGNPSPHGVFAPELRGHVVTLLDLAVESSTNPHLGNAIGYTQVNNRIIKWAAVVEGQVWGTQLGNRLAPGYGAIQDVYTTIINPTYMRPVTMYPGWPR